MLVHGKYFYGNEISEYGQQNGYVDYGTLAKSFDAVLNNDIMQKTWDVVGYWEQESGFINNAEEIAELQEQIDELEEEVENLKADRCPVCGKILELEDYETYYDEDAEDSSYRIVCSECNYNEITDGYIKVEKDIKKIEELQEKIEELQDKINELEEEVENFYNAECYQYYIVSDNGAEILKEINEIVFYNEELDMYVWGVTHYGTSWSYVLTDIRCNVPYEDEE